jgi:hypothetical protein
MEIERELEELPRSGVFLREQLIFEVQEEPKYRS